MVEICANCKHPIILSPYTNMWYHDGDVGTGEHYGKDGKYTRCNCETPIPISEFTPSNKGLSGDSLESSQIADATSESPIIVSSNRGIGSDVRGCL